MIEYANEEVRAAFHALPIDKQRDWLRLAEIFLSKGKTLKLFHVESFAGSLEITVRIDEQLNNPA